MPTVFFASTRSFQKEITAVFDFLWPTATAMWNLRWQVAGYVAARPTATKEELEGRFTTGSGIRGTNLKRSCIEYSWDEQQQEFAELLLINVCALYESWIASTFDALRISNMSVMKQMQFPTSTTKAGHKKGVDSAIEYVTSTESACLKSAFNSALRSQPKYSKPSLDNLLICYRYFKEIRNAIVHNGGMAQQTLLNAYQDFAAVATSIQLGVTEVPGHEPVTIGTPVTVRLRGVVGLTDVLHRIVVTLDAELSRSTHAEREFRKRWLSIHGRRFTLKTRDRVARQRQLIRLVTKLQFPRPASVSELEKFLVNEHLVN